MTIRKAVMADIDVLRQFEQGVIAAERLFDSSLKPDPILYYNLPEMMAAPHIELLVAEVDGQVAASGYARIETSLHFVQHTQHAYLGFMYTLPQHRGKGINRQIIEALRNWAAAKEVYALVLEVYPGNQPAISAYEKAGFHGYILQMKMFRQ
jgi:ribosomal protein S18 acetylase RimI-like enzyme